MNRSRRSAALVAAALAGTLAISACSSSGSSGGKVKGAAPKNNSSGINPQPASNVKQGGTLRIANRGITNMNPYETDGSNADADWVRSMTLPNLFNYDAKGNPTPNPYFLQSATSSMKGGKQVVEYKLNPKSKWSDGTPISYKDFVQIWKSDSGKNSKFLVRGTTGYDQIASVTKGANDQDVLVTYDKPQLEWQNLFGELVPANTIDTPDKFNKSWLQKMPATAGPFKIQKWDTAAKAITLVPDPNWWGPKPKLDKIVDTEMEAPAQVNAVLNNELDVAGVSNAEFYKRVAGKKGLQVRVGTPWDVLNLVYGSKGPMADVKVRQAIMMGVNRTDLSKIQSNGMPKQNPLVNNHLYMPQENGYEDTSGQFGKYDPTAAGKLLDAAGWKSAGAGKTRTKGGKPLSLHFVMSAGTSQTGLDICSAVQTMLQQIGIKVTIDKVDDAAFFTNKYVMGGNFDITMFRWTGALWKSGSFDSYRNPQGGNLFQNFGGVGSPQIDTAYRAGINATSKAQGIQDFNTADKQIWEVGNSSPLFQNYAYDAVRTGLANYGAFGLDTPDWTKVGWQK
ncbi:hypothetical protein BIV57_07330 [Mangrovactinospora gilvigrisea]|uniref:Solute-binding protein family 5 domain-containing protein n=1 Tax=Mangrovactinospora gilvigrisea TaxID=1428644 RepID=A0A1J7C9C7_9ACTN|nr:ABC transporter family substrate-binding protein [Mangrovactinospora gilvigrisea]OIV38124.1 hypothetical protein BIV57_07330 [Mangrovactinospora gilvigrisea]